MVKPQLPEDIQVLFPLELVRLIDSFVPHNKKSISHKTSPSLQRELARLQNKNLKGKSPTYMRGLDDFVLDRYTDYLI
jgi:hypothetical protein